ncbi:MAG: tyrosine-type recombinase/integrase [Candidatus Aenigmarchaeota archaeon]|nr:tyrosine-type recombinase/integrase [Candidatus Aenigmarchaeota archaeon]
MKEGDEIWARMEKIKNMDVNAENIKTVVEFDKLNEINGLTPGTRVGHLTMLRHLLTYCGGKPFTELTGSDIREFMGLLKESKVETQVDMRFNRNVAKRGGKLEQGTMNTYTQKVKRFFRYLHNTGRDTPKVIRDADLKQKQVAFKLTSADLPTEQEILNMINATESPLYKALLAVMYDTGMRIGDILDLKFKDLMVTENEVRLRFYIRKTKQHLLYSLGSSVGFLMNWHNLHPTKDPESPLFCTTATNCRGKRMSHTNAYNMVKMLAEKANIHKKVSCHTFRHCATARDKPHYSDEELRVLRGWTRNSTMPLRYAPVSNDAVFRKKQILEGKIKDELQPKIIEARSCPRCKNTVTPDSAYCCVCGQLLSKKVIGLKDMLENPLIYETMKSEIERREDLRQKYQQQLNERVMAFS